MIPILYESTETAFDSFGIGALRDCISCVVTEARNDAYELEMRYPVTGKRFDEIFLREIILAKPNFTDQPQPFRIYKISKPLNGIVTIYAQHLVYDLSGYVDSPFSAIGIQAAMSAILSNTNIVPMNCPFQFSTDKSVSSTFKVDKPTSARALMGGVRGSLLDVYGGEWHYDRLSCTLNTNRGTDRGVYIRYGKNLTSIQQEENISSVYTKVYPFYRNAETEELVTLPSKTVSVQGFFDFERVLPLDLTDRFETVPTVSQLQARTEKYIADNEIGVPPVSLAIGFEQMGTLKDRVDLCDTVHVVFDRIGVSASAKCVKTKWDTLRERYISIELGSARGSISGTIAGISEKAQDALRSASQQGETARAIADSIASKVTGNLGGYVVMHDSDGDGNPDEILIMDDADIEQAVNIVRMNQNGIAFSQDGYHGAYVTAWNIDGEFVADFIQAGTLRANLVKILGDTKFYWDASNIYIIDPSNSAHQIRIGKYNGTDYGIGFTRDNGVTWQTAIDFNGLNVTAIQEIANDALATAAQAVVTAENVRLAVEEISIGGTNWFEKSDGYYEVTGPSPNTSFQFAFGDIANHWNLFRGKQITVSFDIELENATGNGTGVFIEPQFWFSDSTYQNFEIVYALNSTPQTFSIRATKTFTVQDKALDHVAQSGIYIYGLTGGRVKVGRPKLEIGNKPTDWTPAPTELKNSSIDISREGISILTDGVLKIAGQTEGSFLLPNGGMTAMNGDFSNLAVGGTRVIGSGAEAFLLPILCKFTQGAASPPSGHNFLWINASGSSFTSASRSGATSVGYLPRTFTLNAPDNTLTNGTFTYTLKFGVTNRQGSNPDSVTGTVTATINGVTFSSGSITVRKWETRNLEITVSSTTNLFASSGTLSVAFTQTHSGGVLGFDLDGSTMTLTALKSGTSGTQDVSINYVP